MEAVCLATADMLDAHMPMIAAAVAATERLVREAAETQDATEELREHVAGLVDAGRDVAQRLGRGADMAVHLLTKQSGRLEPGRALQLRRELLARIGHLGEMSAELRIAQAQLARIAPAEREPS